MSLKTNRKENVLELAGKLNTETAPKLEAVLGPIFDNENSLVIDMKDLEYISSAGLRVILMAHKFFSEKAGMLYEKKNGNHL